MNTETYLEERAVALLRRLLPNFEAHPISRAIPRTTERSVEVNLPAAVTADYSFVLCFSPEMQIGAKLVLPDEATTYPHFWYLPFESAAFRNRIDALENAFYKTLEIVLTHETRITQKNGLVLTHFGCEYRTAGTWKRVGGVSYVRFNFKVPRISGRKHVYHSLALADQAFIK
jgi:hypothetical protein